MASREAQKSAERNKLNYDVRAREATLDVGDRVLVRQVGLKGKHKLADKWQKDPFIVVGIPTNNIPVFRVQKESDVSCIKTLHRNMLLPFSAIPSAAEFSEPSTKQKSLSKTFEIKKKQHTDSSSSEESDSDQSESDYSVPRYIIRQKRDRTSFKKAVKSKSLIYLLVY